MEEIRKLFGQNVRKYRLAHCWSQAELAEKIEISDAFMAHIERGTRGASMETIELLARCFEIPYAALFEETPGAGANYAQVLFTLEHELQDKLSADIAACIKTAQERL